MTVISVGGEHAHSDVTDVSKRLINGYPGVYVPASAASPVLGRNSSPAAISMVPAPAEVLLGLSPSVESTSKILNFQALKRALPTTIESFEDEVNFMQTEVMVILLFTILKNPLKNSNF